MTDFTEATASDLRELYLIGTVSPVDVTKSMISKIRRLNPGLNAYCFIDEGNALSQARESEERYRLRESQSRLDGIPIAVKDLLDVKGWPTKCGSRALPNTPAGADSPQVSRLREAGAVLMGKTTTTEFGWKASSHSPATGLTVNPWNAALSCGGSSSGSAVAVAAGMVTVAVGTDAGGSVRIPASMTGITGMKPTHGRVPSWPPNAYSSFSQTGPMARSVADAQALLSVLSRPNRYDTVGYPNPTNADVSPAKVSELQILYQRDESTSLMPEVEKTAGQVVRLLEEQGANVTVRSVAWSAISETFSVLWQASAAQLYCGLTETQRETLDPGLRAVCERGATLSQREVAHAESQRLRVTGEFNALHHEFDLLLSPTLSLDSFSANLAFPEGVTLDNPLSWVPYCYVYNLTGQPAISLPCGVSDRGVPIGIQLAGQRYRDDMLLNYAYALAPYLNTLFKKNNANRSMT